mgnify:FL=1
MSTVTITQDEYTFMSNEINRLGREVRELIKENKKLKEEIEEDNECEKLIMEIWANGGDRDEALPIHYRQKKANGEWGIDEDE